MNPTKVFMTGGDGVGWALDDDLALTRQALGDSILETTLEASEVVHSVWWEGLIGLSDAQLAGKRIISHVPGEPRRYFALPAHRHQMNRVGRWVTRTRQATRQLRDVGGDATYVPYAIGTDLFRPLDRSGPGLDGCRRRWGLPDDRYLIGSFHRDSEGADLSRPKLVKGPDLFVEMVLAIHRTGAPVHVVLAGPRRHWVRTRLEQASVPYTFVGTVRDDDDMDVNILDRTVLNQLYNLLDLYVVSSRSEGGPQSIMEAASARCPIISSRVGLADDILDPSCIYDDCAAAVKVIDDDIRHRRLRSTLDAHQQRIRSSHNPEAAAEPFRDLYAQLDAVPVYRPRTGKRTTGPLWGRIAAKLGRRPRVSAPEPLTVGVWHRFSPTSAGGENPFMPLLMRALRARNVRLVENDAAPNVDVYLLDSVHFDLPAFESVARRCRVKVVHRMEVPVSPATGIGRGVDAPCFRLNAQFASATILESAWAHESIAGMGYKPVNPVQIMNAADPDLFSRRGRSPLAPGKLRLISTLGPGDVSGEEVIYEWLDQQLDWGRFDYTLVGRASRKFRRIRLVDPVPPEVMADLLQQHDVYLLANRTETRSNDLICALACGLPALYCASGPIPVVIGHGGLPFSGTDDILARLDTLSANRTMFRNLIQVPSLDDVVDSYLAILREVAAN